MSTRRPLNAKLATWRREPAVGTHYGLALNRTPGDWTSWDCGSPSGRRGPARDAQMQNT